MDRVHVGHGSQFGSLTLFPVWSEAPAARFDVVPVNTLHAGELNEPVVSRLRLRSEHPVPLLVPEGTLLAGGMQTRVLSQDAGLPAHGDLEVAAFCVERGRWHGASSHTVVGRAPMSVVAASRSIPGASRNSRGQGEVWDRVSRQESRFGSRPTSSLVDVMFDQHSVGRSDEQEQAAFRLRQLTTQLESYQPLRGQSGILVGVGGHPILLEVMSNSRAFARHIEMLLKGLAVDAAAAPAIPTPGRRARRFAEIAMNTNLLEASREDVAIHSVGSGDLLDIRALQVRSSAVHTVAINKILDLVLAA
jgi:hypothetical protein